eukprot:2112570-Rhodomonas_salina.1
MSRSLRGGKERVSSNSAQQPSAFSLQYYYGTRCHAPFCFRVTGTSFPMRYKEKKSTRRPA